MTEEAKALETVLRGTFQDLVGPLAEKLEELNFKIDEREVDGKQNWLRFNSMLEFRAPAPFSGSFVELFTDWLE